MSLWACLELLLQCFEDKITLLLCCSSSSYWCPTSFPFNFITLVLFYSLNPRMEPSCSYRLKITYICIWIPMQLPKGTLLKVFTPFSNYSLKITIFDVPQTLDYHLSHLFCYWYGFQINVTHSCSCAINVGRFFNSYPFHFWIVYAYCYCLSIYPIVLYSLYNFIFSHLFLSLKSYIGNILISFGY